MQPTTNKPDWLLFILSAIAIIIIGIAGFAHYIGFDVAIEWIIGILGANGLIGATKWQAAPGLVAAMQTLIEELAAHIQAIHAAQQSTSTKTVTTKAYQPTGVATAAPTVPGVPPRASDGA